MAFAGIIGVVVIAVIVVVFIVAAGQPKPFSLSTRKFIIIAG